MLVGCALSMCDLIYFIMHTHHYLGRYLNCAQLALIVNKFPDGSELHNEYSTYRVELIVRLFSRLVDLINFDYVLKELEQAEYAMVVFRLGWLNVWNPLKAEGAIQLGMCHCFVTV